MVPLIPDTEQESPATQEIDKKVIIPSYYRESIGTGT